MYESNGRCFDVKSRANQGFERSNYCNSQVSPFRGSSDQFGRGRFQKSPHYRDHPPGMYRPRRKFVVQMISECRKSGELVELKDLIEKLRLRPVNYSLVASGNIVGRLFYEQWSHVLETVVQLWDLKFNGFGLQFVPNVINDFDVPSDMLELSDQLKVLFLQKLSQFKEGDPVAKWLKEIQSLADEIKQVTSLLASLQNLVVCNELLKKKKGLEAEKDLILNRVEEFRNGIDCIEYYLKGEKKNDEGFIPCLRFNDGEIDWRRIYRLVMREIKRLEDGLPIFGRRQDMLMQMHNQQVLVLIGETGSGKSTQLIQFLADSGVHGHGSIVCTQPRKLAAISVAERVKEECHGCYEDSSVTCYPSYSSSQPFDHSMIFMTDNCLLQHYIMDRQLSKISCIIIDEAHERSLHTDLLLALIKKLLCQRPFLKLVIMSATADADQFAEYFSGCRLLNVPGRCYPVEIKYVPSESEGCSPANVSPYVVDVLKMVSEIDRTEKDGTILAFLTSQIEIEWACENFQSDSAVILPLHGKLSCADQHRVFQTYPGKRKVIFATNIAETSITIPGVKYVVDSGMVMESRYEPSNGMNVLKVCHISQSSANQRAGRAGRTEPGVCYRLYDENDFNSMMPYQEPQIRKVHLGIAILKILALGIKNVENFDFVDAPSDESISMAIRNLIQLGAITSKGDEYELTAEGQEFVKLGIEPRLAKIILKSFRHRLGREGLVLAAVMANSSSIFCRVGTSKEKFKSDCLKVQFCHPSGDLFTLLAVYKEWEAQPLQQRNIWCWENSINAKSMKRCQDAVTELEACLERELNIIVLTYWRWDPKTVTEHDKTLQDVILSSLPENVAMYSGYDQLGYEVALTGKCFQLHPSCSLLSFGQRPSWVIFGEVLSTSSDYLLCVTACDFECLSTSTLFTSPECCFSSMERKRLQKKTLSGFGSVLLKRFCGKSNGNLNRVVSIITASCADERCGVEVDVDQNEVHLYASSSEMENVSGLVVELLECENKFLKNECLIKGLYEVGPAALPPVALFGAGAEIKHLELEKRNLSVDIFHSDINSVDDKDLLGYLERFTEGHICKITRFYGVAPESEMEKWGSVTFLTPDAAMKASVLRDIDRYGGSLEVVPSRNKGVTDSKISRFPPLKANVEWPRRESKGFALVRCYPEDVNFLIEDFSGLVIGGRYIRSETSKTSENGVFISGLGKELSEDDITKVLCGASTRPILGLHLFRGKIVECPPLKACEEGILREISPFMPKRNPQSNSVHVQVMEPRLNDEFMKAVITFDGDLHFAAAKALEQIEGKILPGMKPWQKIRCEPLFRSSVSCSSSVYNAIKNQLQSLLERLRRHKGVKCNLVENRNGSMRVDISARGTRTVAEVRRPLEQLMRGKNLQHSDITPSVIQSLFTRDGAALLKSTQRETGTHIIFERDKKVVRIFGSPEKIERAHRMLVSSLLALHDSKQQEVQLRNSFYPPDMMKRVVERFGPDLRGLKERFHGAELSLNAKRHSISISGSSKEWKQKVEKAILELAETCGPEKRRNEGEAICGICLCDLEDPYKLEGCCHRFCRSCLIEQMESAIQSHGIFPLRCAREGCGIPILLVDLRILLPEDKLDELFRASLSSFVASSRGAYRFCPSPDCPSVYRITDHRADPPAPSFLCEACLVETCTRCHMESHPYFVSCEQYLEFKNDPDSSLKEWCLGKEHVKRSPCCGLTIEKIDGCNHISCKCGKHICWVCLRLFDSGEDCYAHLRSVHEDII